MTEVTKEAIEAAVEEIRKVRKTPAWDRWTDHDAIGAVLSAALPFLSSPGKYGGQEVEAEEAPAARLYDDKAPMADGGDEKMTAAEEVMAWLLIEKIGVPDDVGYSPNQAQEIIVRRLEQLRELEQIDEMLDEGQGDDQGHPIMPEFTKGMTTYAKVEACLHLLERRRDALHPSPLKAKSPSRDRAASGITPHAFAQEYEFRGDTAYTPTDGERTMIEDAICGYLAEAKGSGQ